MVQKEVTCRGLMLDKSKILSRGLLYTILVFIAFYTIFPLYHMTVISFQPSVVGLFTQISLTPKGFSLKNYIDLFTKTSMPRWILNTAIYAGGVALLTIFLDSLTAFALAKGNFPLRNTFFLIILTGLMIPGQAILIPLFKIMVSLGWVNTYWGIIIPGIVSPSGVFLMRQYMLGIPDELLDSARIDGSSEFSLYWRIIFPLSIPVIATVAALKFIMHWNTFLFPLIMMRHETMFTIPVGIATFTAWAGATLWGQIMAGSVVAVVPTIVVFLVFQKKIIESLSLRFRVMKR